MTLLDLNVKQLREDTETNCDKLFEDYWNNIVFEIEHRARMGYSDYLVEVKDCKVLEKIYLRLKNYEGFSIHLRDEDSGYPKITVSWMD